MLSVDLSHFTGAGNVDLTELHGELLWHYWAIVQFFESITKFHHS